MKKSKASSKRSRPRNKSHLIYALLALVLGLSCHSCTNISAGRELAAAGNGLEEFVKELSTAVREHAGTPDVAPKAETGVHRGNAAESFSACPKFFANAQPPVVAPRPTDRALCYDAFAILHSGESKTPV